MDVIQLSAESKRKPMGRVAQDLGLHPQFAAPGALQDTVLLLAKHIDELRDRVAVLEQQAARRWWHRPRFWRSA